MITKENILILSQDQFEISTDNVIDWILHFNKKFTRINADFLNENVNSTTYSSYDGKWDLLNNIDLNQIHAFWFRRWNSGPLLHNYGEQLNNSNPGKHKQIFQKHYKVVENIFNENSAIVSFFLFHLNNYATKFLTNPGQIGVNKLIVLDVAKRAGLKVAEYIITNNKNDIRKFLSNSKKIINKDLNIPFVYFHPLESCLTYAEIINEQNFKLLPESFYPSLVQEYVEKDIEIRVFYLDKKLYSMAIFSQNDKKTMIDFRKYNLKKPNRNVPYKLPIDIEEKIVQLMNILRLDTGSIDLIKTKKNEYFFLEVNPVGQFGMVSEPCNYNLEKKIAEYLVN